MKRILFIIIVIVLILGGVTLVKMRKKQLDNTPLPRRSISSFHVGTIYYGSLQVREHYSGILLAEQTVDLAPQIQGRILSVYRREGDEFNAGEILVKIDGREIHQQINSLIAEVKRLESEFHLQRTIFNRKKALFENSAISQQAMDEADATFKQALHRLEGGKAQLASAKTRLKYSTLKTPFSGIVVRQLQEPGDMALPGKPVLKIENPAKGYKINVQIPEKLTTSVTVGSAVVLISGNDIKNATVSKVLPSINEGTSLGEIEIFSEKRPFGLPSGSHLGVEITVKRPEGYVVPERSILYQKDTAHLFVVGPENKIISKKIDVLGYSGSKVLVSGQLKEEDRVIVSDESRLLSLEDGQLVNPLKGSGQ